MRFAPTEHWPHNAPRALATSLLLAGYRCEAPVTQSVPQEKPATEKNDGGHQPIERARLRKTTFVQVQKGHIAVVE